MNKYLTQCLLALALAFGSSRAVAAPMPMISTARNFMVEVLDLAKTSKSSHGKSDTLIKAKVKALSERVDFEALARSSLGSARWSKQPEALRKRFRVALQELLELVVYPEAQGLIVDADKMIYSEVKGRPQSVRVFSKIQRERRGEIMAEDLEMILVFNKDKTRPLLVDTVLDGEPISANLRRQFDRALEKQSFEQIIQKIEKRVQEARNPGKADAKKSS